MSQIDLMSCVSGEQNSVSSVTTDGCVPHPFHSQEEEITHPRKEIQNHFFLSLLEQAVGPSTAHISTLRRIQSGGLALVMYEIGN